MKEYKLLSWFSLIGCFITLLSGICFYGRAGLSIYYDISISIFAAFIVIFFTSLLSYFIHKKKTVENFYEEAQYIMRDYIELQYYREGELDKRIDGVLMLNNINYMPLDREFSNLQFFSNKGKVKKKIDEIYAHIRKVRHTVNNDNLYHLKLYKHNEGTSKKESLEGFIEPIYKLFLNTDNDIVDKLQLMLNDLHKLMYGKKI